MRPEINELLDTYGVDLAHARHVADLALSLFDTVRARYELPAASRQLLEVGALLHNVGVTTNPPDHHLVGRDIVLRHVLDDLSGQDQAIVACLVVFHRKKVRPQLEPAYLSLGKKGQALALRLAAILRVADGLDYSQSQSTALLGADPLEPAGLQLRLEGQHAAGDGARAVAKADLWLKVFGEPLSAPPAADGAAPPADAAAAEGEVARLAPWYAAADAPLAELGRVLLRRHFRSMLAAERAVRADTSIEAVHDLRVATRRLRASLELLGAVAPADSARRFVRALRRVARAAGAVRDRDVLLEHLAASRERLPEELRAGLDEVAAAVSRERAGAYARLIGRVDSAEHAVFTRDFASTMNSHTGWAEAARVRDLAGSTIWRHYEALRAHDCGGPPTEPEALHAARIDAKRLRYVLELFAESLGPQLSPLVAQLAELQEDLGTLNDGAVAPAVIADLPLDEPARAAAAAYLELRAADAVAATAGLAPRWAKLNAATYRRKLMDLIVKL